MAESSEDELLAWLGDQLPEGSRALVGDDAAILALQGEWAVTTDSQVEGVHTPRGFPPARLAHRLLAVNLSDLAAMGARPRYALLALTARPGFDHRSFFEAFLVACSRHGVLLAGGDLARSPHATTATLTLFGDRPDGRRWLRRDEAAPGDTLWVSGTLGSSALGLHLLATGGRCGPRSIDLPSALCELSPALRAAARQAIRRHVAPSPRLALGAWLARRPRSAAIDLSDGLGRDLGRLCRRSGTGAIVDAEAIPLAEHYTRLCEHLGLSPSELSRHGGEDYELLFTLPDSLRPPQRFACSAIGVISEEPSIVLEHADGTSCPLPDRGWDHLQGCLPGHPGFASAATARSRF